MTLNDETDSSLSLNAIERDALPKLKKSVSNDARKTNLDSDKFLRPALAIENMDLYYARASILRALQEQLFRFHGTLVDIGCGEMPYKDLLLSRSKIERYIGIDIENPTYQTKKKPDLFWDGKTIPMDDNQVDVAVATEFFEHVPHPDTVIGEIYRVLKTGGILFFTVPFIWPLHDMPHDEFRYTPFSLGRLLRESGFESVTIKAMGGWNASLAQVIGLWARRKEMSEKERMSFSEKLFPMYKWLIESDQLPTDFNESMLMTGLSGTACKETIGTARDRRYEEVSTSISQKASVVRLSDTRPTCLAILTPVVGAVSETFIQRQIELLSPGRTIVIAREIADSSKIKFPVLFTPFATGPAKYHPQIERKVVEFVRKHNVTHILCQYGSCGSEMVDLNARTFHLPIFMHFHGFDASKMLRDPQMVEYYGWLGQHVDGVIAVSDVMSQRLIKAGIPKQKVHVVHYGVEIPDEPATHRIDGVVNLLSVTRLVPKKGPLLLLDSIRKAHNIEPELQLDIVGDGPLRTEVEKFIRDNEMSSFVRLHGAQPSAITKEQFRKADIYVQHSMTDPQTGDAEGLPNTILEASAYGLPVVSTFHEGIPEEIEDGGTGFLVQEGDINAMADCVIRLVRDPELRRTMGAAGRKRMQETFTVEQQMELLRHVMNLQKIDNAGKMDGTVLVPFDYKELLAEAESAIQSGEMRRAKTALDVILVRNPKDVAALDDLAAVEILVRDFDSASRTIAKVLEIDPANNVARSNLKTLKNLLTKELDNLKNCHENDVYHYLELQERFPAVNSDEDKKTSKVNLTLPETSPIKSENVFRNNVPCSDVKVSICIPTYNRAKFISEALRSSLDQTHPCYEVLVVDDGSTDDTKHIVESLGCEKVRYIFKEHSGGAAARNMAVAEAKGDFVLWVDSDDVLMPNALAGYFETLNEFPEADVLYGNLFVTDEHLRQLREFKYEDWFGRNAELVARLLNENPIPNGGTMIRKKCYAIVGEYDESFIRAHDYEWWTRIAKAANFKHVDSIVYKWRWHDSNMSSGTVKIDTSFDARIVRSMLVRYTLRELFPAMNWQGSSIKKVEATVYFKVALRLISLDDGSGGIEFLEKSLRSFPSEQAENLLAKLRSLMRQSNLESSQPMKETSRSTVSVSSEISKNILVVAHNFPSERYAGVEIYTYQFVKGLIKRGYNVSVLYPKLVSGSSTTSLSEEFFHGARIYKLLIGGNHDLDSHITNGKIEEIFRKLLQKEKPGVVHFEHTHAYLPFSLLTVAKEKGIPVCLTLHDFWFVCVRTHFYIPESKTICEGPTSAEKCARCITGSAYENLSPAQRSSLIKFFEHRSEYVRQLFRKVDIISSPSAYVADKIKSLEFGKDKIEVNQLGLIPIRTEKKRKAVGNEIIFGYLGSVQELKNVVFLAESFRQVVGNARLSIRANGLPQAINVLKEVIEGDDRISYHGPYAPEDLPRIFSEMDVVVVPSLMENYPLVVRETLSAGVPVIASNVGGIPEIVHNGVNGILFNPYDENELINIIQRIVDEPSTLTALNPNAVPIKTMEEDVNEWVARYDKLTLNPKSGAKGSAYIPDGEKGAPGITVSIIIPVFNKVEYTERCINALFENTDRADFEVIIVDNASTDRTKDYLQWLVKDRKNVVVIHNEKNIGFGKTNNQAAKIAKGKYLLLLNNDTEPQPGWLSPLVKILDTDPSVAVAGSKLLFPNGTIQHAGIGLFDRSRAGGEKIVALHVHYKERADLPEANEPRCYQALTAASQLVRKEVFQELGGFDEGFLNGYEDADLCLRIQEKGFKLVYQPESVVIHYESQSGLERYSNVTENVSLLNRKWANRVVYDGYIDENGNQVLSNTHRIKKYVAPSGSEEHEHGAPQASIIILTYNQLQYTKATIDSIRKHTRAPHEIIVVDNASTDGTVKYLKAQGDIRTIFNEKNLGFPAGCNQGIEIAKGEYLVLLNNDVIVTDDWLEGLIECADSSHDIGIVGPMTNWISGLQLERGVTYKKVSQMPAFAAAYRRRHRMAWIEVPRIAGFCTLIKREVVNKIGGLSTIFGIGNCEDDDYCLRAKLSGFKVVLAGDVFIHHFGSKSFGKEGLDGYLAIVRSNEKIFKEKWGVTPTEWWKEGKIPSKRPVLFSPLTAVNVPELTNESIENSENEWEALYQDARNLAIQGKIDEAVSRLEDLLKTNPNHSGALNDIGALYFQRGEKDKANQSFLDSIKAYPLNMDALRNLADLYLDAGQLEEAAKAYGEILTIKPNDSESVQKVGYICSMLGKSEDAEFFNSLANHEA